MPAVPISEIVAFTGGRYSGPADRMIDGVAPLAGAGEAQLSFLSNPKYASELASTAFFEPTAPGRMAWCSDATGARIYTITDPSTCCASLQRVPARVSGWWCRHS